MFKRILALLLILLMLPLSGFAYDQIITMPTLPIEVPYEVTYYFWHSGSYYIHDMWDLDRLLALCKQTGKEALSLYPDGKTMEEITAAVNAFLAENSENFWWEPSCKVKSNHLEIEMDWKIKSTYELPVLSNIEDIYAAVCQAKHRTYDKCYLVSLDYISVTEFYERGIARIFEDAEAAYQTDLSPYLHEFYLQNDITGKYSLYLSIGKKMDFAHMQDEEQERYLNLLRAHTFLPIEDTMSEIEKIAVIVATVNNIIPMHIDGGSNKQDDFHDSPQEGDVYFMEVCYAMGRGVCGAYSQMFYDLCTMYGIECQIVYGKIASSPLGHAWNVVKCDDVWYMYEPQNGGYTDAPWATIDHLPLTLHSSQYFLDTGYTWSQSKYPHCPQTRTKEKVTYKKEPVFPDTVKKIEMFEPYFFTDPVAGRAFEIYYNIYFDTETATILAIDTTMDYHYADKNPDDSWTNRTIVLEIPDTLDGKKVKAIGESLDAYFPIPHVDVLSIPDNITVADYGFQGVRTDELRVGSNVTFGINAMPVYDTLYRGENMIFHGFSSAPGGSHNRVYEYYDEYEAATIFYSPEYRIETPNNYTHALWGGGYNILDHEPKNILHITDEVIYVDPRLNRLNRSFEVDENNPYYTTLDGVLYNKDMTELISVPLGMEHIRIPDTVTRIGPYAFSHCFGLNSLTIPSSVTQIADRAFLRVANLETVYFEGAVPQSFQPVFCNLKAVSLQETSATTLDYTMTDGKIAIQNVPQGYTPTAVFYDINGELLEIVRSEGISIPLYAKSWELYLWDNRMKPYTFKEKGEL